MLPEQEFPAIVARIRKGGIPPIAFSCGDIGQAKGPSRRFAGAVPPEIWYSPTRPAKGHPQEHPRPTRGNGHS